MFAKKRCARANVRKRAKICDEYVELAVHAVQKCGGTISLSRCREPVVRGPRPRRAERFFGQLEAAQCNRGQPSLHGERDEPLPVVRVELPGQQMNVVQPDQPVIVVMVRGPVHQCEQQRVHGARREGASERRDAERLSAQLVEIKGVRECLSIRNAPVNVDGILYALPIGAAEVRLLHHMDAVDGRFLDVPKGQQRFGEARQTRVSDEQIDVAVGPQPRFAIHLPGERRSFDEDRGHPRGANGIEERQKLGNRPGFPRHRTCDRRPQFSLQITGELRPAGTASPREQWQHAVRMGPVDQIVVRALPKHTGAKRGGEVGGWLVESHDG